MNNKLPDKFVYLKDVNANIVQDVRYASNENFLGRKVKGYINSTIIITEAAANALSNVQNELEKINLSLKVFDGYRPQMACNDFWDWACDISDIKMKEKYYPDFSDKRDLFNGYIARFSNHSRGSAVDLTILDIKSNKEFDMGGIFDFLGEKSHTESKLVDDKAYKNRMFLKNLMEKFGFINYWREWWHYELIDEPFKRKPEDHFNFEVA